MGTENGFQSNPPLSIQNKKGITKLMPILALILTLLASFFHAIWNLLAKKADERLIFFWLMLWIAVILYLPAFAVVSFTEIIPNLFSVVSFTKAIPNIAWWYIVATGIIHALYFTFLSLAYQKGDLSLVYPLARGTAPLLVPFIAFIFIDESLSRVGFIGICFVIMGIYLIHLDAFSFAALKKPFIAMKQSSTKLAFLTGITIACYSVVDKVGVGYVNPFQYIYLMFLLTALCLAPYAILTKRRIIRDVWNKFKISLIVVGFLCLFTYMLVLFAMRLSEVSYIVSVRQSSLIFATILGLTVLKEKHGRQKIVGAISICLGVVLISIA